MFRSRLLLVVAVLAAGSLLVLPAGTAEAHNCCAPVCQCCPPPPIHTTLCVNPPCSCCSTAVSVCVPGCCVEPPVVCWRSGAFGRKIGTYTWPCCGHEVQVVVTRKGDVRVRG